jgi:hypothetical protein
MVSEYCLLFSTGCTCHLHDWVSLKIKNNSKLSPFHWLIMMFLIKMPIFWGFNNGLIPYVNTWWVSICPITSTENIPMIQSPEIPHGFRVPPLKSAWRQKNLPIIKSVNKYVKVAFTNQKNLGLVQPSPRKKTLFWSTKKILSSREVPTLKGSLQAAHGAPGRQATALHSVVLVELKGWRYPQMQTAI